MFNISLTLPDKQRNNPDQGPCTCQVPTAKVIIKVEVTKDPDHFNISLTYKHNEAPQRILWGKRTERLNEKRK